MIFSFSRKIPRWEVWAFNFDTQCCRILGTWQGCDEYCFKYSFFFLSRTHDPGRRKNSSPRGNKPHSSLLQFMVLGMLIPSLCLRFPICKMGRLTPKYSILKVLYARDTQFVPEEFPAVLSGGPGEVGRTWLQGASSGLPGALPLQNGQRNRKGLCDQGRTTSQRT